MAWMNNEEHCRWRTGHKFTSTLGRDMPISAVYKFVKTMFDDNDRFFQGNSNGTGYYEHQRLIKLLCLMHKLSDITRCNICSQFYEY